MKDLQTKELTKIKMEINEAYDVLNKYYPEDVRQNLYIRKRFDGSETDTNKKLSYNADLLMERLDKLPSVTDEEKHKIRLAAAVFKICYSDAESMR